MNKILTIAAAAALCGCKEDESIKPDPSIYATNRTVTSYAPEKTLSERIQDLANTYEKRIKDEQYYHLSSLSNMVFHGYVLKSKDGSFSARIPEGWVISNMQGGLVPITNGVVENTIVVEIVSTNLAFITSGNKKTWP